MIPFVSESYSSSSDPPEEDIPLCTLKSFPYQPEHCVAWGRNKFDQLFNSDIKMLESCLKISFQTSSFTSIPVEKVEKEAERGIGHMGEDEKGVGGEKEVEKEVGIEELTSVLSSLSALMLSSDDISRLISTLTNPQTSPEAAVAWAVRAFDSTYRVEAENLLKEHPIDEVDENGVPFWGG